MANEATVRSSLTVRKGNTSYGPSKPEVFQADVATEFGPVPGVRNIPTTAAGTVIALTGITTPGLARIQNLDDANYVEIGRQVGGTFYPLLELKPGESCVVRLSRNLTPASDLFARANTLACDVLVEAFNA